MKISGKTKNDNIVIATTAELNAYTGLNKDSYDFGDTLEIDPNFALAENLAEEQAAFNADVQKMKTTIEDIENG